MAWKPTGFVNENVSREDVEKYGLQEIVFRFRPLERRWPESIAYNWTVDRSRDVFLMRLRTGTGELGNRITWVLSEKGRLFEIFTDLEAEGSSKSLDDRPFKIEWSLVRLMPMPDSEVERAEVLGLLKEALTAYGFWGPWRQIPETVVTFRF